MVTQFFASIAFAVPASIIFALAAHGAEITPQSQPVCTSDCPIGNSAQPAITQNDPITNDLAECLKSLPAKDLRLITNDAQKPIILPAPYIGVGTEQD